MTTLERNALKRVPMTREEMEFVYSSFDPDNSQAERLQIFEVVMAICESHERLRMELVGAEKCYHKCDSRLTDLEQAAHLWGLAREALIEAGCHITLGCHVPTVLREWLDTKITGAKS